MEREEIVSISSNGGGLSVIVSDYDDDDGANTFKCNDNMVNYWCSELHFFSILGDQIRLYLI